MGIKQIVDAVVRRRLQTGLLALAALTDNLHIVAVLLPVSFEFGHLSFCVAQCNWTLQQLRRTQLHVFLVVCVLENRFAGGTVELELFEHVHDKQIRSSRWREISAAVRAILLL